MNIELNFRKSLIEELNTESIEIIGCVQFLLEDGTWDGQPIMGIIDTGAPLCIIPLDIWKKAKVEILLDSYQVYGIVPENSIECKVGKISLRLISNQNILERMVLALFAPTNDVNLLVGFSGILDNLILFVNYLENKATLSE